MSTPLLKENLNLLWSSLVLETLRQLGIRDFFFSPGLRNTPLLYALSHSPWAKVTSCIDERAGAYMALGCIRATKIPAAVICTSGTAAANYFPAVVEAYHEGLPLLVITADRPEELWDTDADQTIRQQNLYGQHVAEFYQMPTPSEGIHPAFILSKWGQLYARMVEEARPIHVNMPFSEPLLDSVPIASNYLQICNKWKGLRRTHYAQKTLAKEHLQYVQDAFMSAQRILIVLGKGFTGEQEGTLQLIENLQENSRALICTDITSGVKLKRRPFSGEILYWDHPQNQQFFAAKENWPEMILHLGGRVISRHFYEWLKKIDCPHYVMVNEDPRRSDPSCCVREKILFSPLKFLQALEIGSKADNSYQQHYQNWMEKILAKHALLLQTTQDGPLIHADVVSACGKLLQQKEHLFLGTSLSIRLFEFYGLSAGFSYAPRVFYQRGTNGLEGHIAGPLGTALALGERVVAVIGDIAFLYDLNSLKLMQETQGAKGSLVVIVLNNGGGGIFRRLPVANHFSAMKSEFLLTPHELKDFSALAKQFNLAFSLVKTPRELEESLSGALKCSGHHIIEMMVSWPEDLQFTRLWNNTET